MDRTVPVLHNCPHLASGVLVSDAQYVDTGDSVAGTGTQPADGACRYT